MPQKDCLIGLETELFTLDAKGRVCDSADAIIRKAAGNGAFVKKECAHNMVEILACPECEVKPAMKDLVANLRKVNDAAHGMGYRLFPLGTYPGSFKPRMRTSKCYRVKKELFGQRFVIGGRCIGFHCHYDAPCTSFSHNLRNLELLDLIPQRCIINAYNFLIASEPALGCLMQSSPFYQGIHIGKDSRIIIYRGGRNLDSPFGMYADFEQFGQLQGYKHTIPDIIGTIEDRFSDWIGLIKTIGLNIRTLALYHSVLSTAWNPIKINPHNTLEQRGMDMNYISHVTAATASIKAVLNRIYTDHLEVIPSEEGNRRPFSISDRTMHVPEEDMVRKGYQKSAAYSGLSDRGVKDYVGCFMRLASSSVQAHERKLLLPFRKAMEHGTVSDSILMQARKLGWQKGTRLGDDEAAEIALHSSHRFDKDLSAMEKVLHT